MISYITGTNLHSHRAKKKKSNRKGKGTDSPEKEVERRGTKLDFKAPVILAPGISNVQQEGIDNALVPLEDTKVPSITIEASSSNDLLDIFATASDNAETQETQNKSTNDHSEIDVNFQKDNYIDPFAASFEDMSAQSTNEEVPNISVGAAGDMFVSNFPSLPLSIPTNEAVEAPTNFQGNQQGESILSFAEDQMDLRPFPAVEKGNANEANTLTAPEFQLENTQNKNLSGSGLNENSDVNSTQLNLFGSNEAVTRATVDPNSSCDATSSPERHNYASNYYDKQLDNTTYITQHDTKWSMDILNSQLQKASIYLDEKYVLRR